MADNKRHDIVFQEVDQSFKKYPRTYLVFGFQSDGHGWYLAQNAMSAKNATDLWKPLRNIYVYKSSRELSQIIASESNEV